jgi:hypothetical protein
LANSSSHAISAPVSVVAVRPTRQQPGSRGIDAARRAECETGCVVAVHGIGHDVVDVDGAWRATTGLHGGGALLVRPDHHVAARSDEDLSPATVAALLASICCSTATARSVS